MMLATGQKVKKLVFYGAGIKIIPSKNCETEQFVREILVLGAGCSVNFAVYLFLASSEQLSAFGTVNLAIGLFNALPLFFLDGGKIIIQCFYRFFRFEKAVIFEKGLKNISAIIIIAAAALMCSAGMGNFTIYITLIFLLITSLLM